MVLRPRAIFCSMRFTYEFEKKGFVIFQPKNVEPLNEIRDEFLRYISKSIKLKKIDNLEKKHTLTIYFQGCTQDGFCYIPFKKEVSL